MLKNKNLIKSSERNLMHLHLRQGRARAHEFKEDKKRLTPTHALHHLTFLLCRALHPIALCLLYNNFNAFDGENNSIISAAVLSACHLCVCIVWSLCNVRFQQPTENVPARNQFFMYFVCSFSPVEK